MSKEYCLFRYYGNKTKQFYFYKDELLKFHEYLKTLNIKSEVITDEKEMEKYDDKNIIDEMIKDKEGNKEISKHWRDFMVKDKPNMQYLTYSYFETVFSRYSLSKKQFNKK